VSQSPTEAVDAAAAPAYIDGLREWTRRVQRGASHSGRERNGAFLNLGQGEFAEVAAISGLDFLDDARGVVSVDWDADGDLDLWLANRTGPQLRLMLNRLESDARWVAFRLEASAGNRDAIGARVELRVGERTLVRTLRAGEGFLSQSSKQLHFGLGAADTIDELVVHWLGGAAEKFSGVAPGQLYRLRQGSGKARLLRRDAVAIAGPPAVGETTATDRRRLWLTGRPPLPRISYASLEGEQQELAPSGRPTLLNLWASWCTPCIGELGELAQRRDEIEAAGLRVVALSVDGLGDERAVESHLLADTLRQLGFDYPSGIAPADLIDRLELLHTQLFGRYVALPVPVSFLIDPGGRIAAIYFGATTVDALLADVARLALSTEGNRAQGDRVAGRWLGAPPALDLQRLAAAYLDSDYVEDAIPLLRIELERNPSDVSSHYNLATILIRAGRYAEAGPHLVDATRIDPQHAGAFGNLGLVLGRLGRLQAAAEVYRRAVALAPDRANLRLGLGRTLLRLGRGEQAERELSAVLSLDASNMEARIALAWLLATTPDDELRDPARALALASVAQSATGTDVPEILDVLAAACAATGDFTSAVKHAREAVRLFRAAGKAGAADQAAARQTLFESGRD